MEGTSGPSRPPPPVFFDFQLQRKVDLVHERTQSERRDGDHACVGLRTTVRVESGEVLERGEQGVYEEREEEGRLG
jgi:hypothetical protein